MGRDNFIHHGKANAAAAHGAFALVKFCFDVFQIFRGDAAPLIGEIQKGVVPIL